MKRLRSSDSLGALMTVCPTSEEHGGSPRKSHVYEREFRSMLEGLSEEEDVSGHVSEKKRRLSVDQVKALEKNFDVENKLEPERKVKLAQELGLQPRQVAVWFQNRRARWKTKQLERDYAHLKANYDALKLNFDALHRDNETLLKQIKELKSKMSKENVEEEEVIIKQKAEETLILPSSDDDDVDTNVIFIHHFRDGSSDSDSSAVLNDTNNVVVQTQQLMTNDMSSSSFVKIEEHNFFSGEETTTCDFFSDDQPPTLPWYCSGDDQWT